jgi:hypothetical protein
MRCYFARALSLSFFPNLRISLVLSNNDKYTTIAKPVCKTSSGAIRILRAGVLAHIFPCAAATGFKTAYRTIATRISRYKQVYKAVSKRLVRV